MAEENSDKMLGLTDSELDERFAAAVRRANEEKIIKGTPLPKYDAKAKQAYLEYADGHKEFIRAS